MLAYYYPQGKQRRIDRLTETDSYKNWEVHVRPRRGARRGFATTERALRVSVNGQPYIALKTFQEIAISLYPAFIHSFNNVFIILSFTATFDKHCYQSHPT